MAGDPLRQLVLPRLEGVRKSGAGFMARCPAHPDSTASLSLGVGKDQPVVLHCHAGCDRDDILTKLGLTWEQVCEPRQPTTDWSPAGPIEAVYDYHDEHGTLLFQVVRAQGKKFLQRRPDPAAKSGWTWRLDDTRRVLFRLPALIQALADGREVWITEGEKDALALIAAGVPATTAPGGAGKWRVEYAPFLREATVTVVADRDAPGQAHARTVAAALTEVGAVVRIVEAAHGKDAADHLGAGLGLADFTITWDSERPSPVELAPDIWEFLGTPEEPYDWIVPGLIERGDRLILTGFEGLGKSMLIRQLAVTIAAGLDPFTFEEITPHRVLLIDCENSERQSRRKLGPIAAASITAGRRVPDGNLRLIHRPEGIDLTRATDAAWLLERVTAHKPDVLFVGPFYRLHAQNTNDELPARQVVSVLDAARTQARCALVTEAHSGHGNADHRSVRPAGSSLLLRWPEFGLGLRPDTDEKPCKVVELAAWRGGRDEREWPSALCWNPNPGFPWLPTASKAELGAVD